MKKSAVLVNKLFFLLGILCIVYYLGMGIAIRFGQSLLFLWPLLGAVCLLRWALTRRAWKRGRETWLPRRPLTALRVLVLLGLAFFLFVEGFVVSGAFHRAPAGLDGIVVLGARVNADGPSGALRNRIDTAAAYLRENPGTRAVASGGQGADEPMSEARCIFEELTAAGIDPARIDMEETSTDTVENLSRSFALLEEGTRTVGIVTNSFHVFRAMGIARRLGGYDFYGVPVGTSVFGFVHYTMREFFAVCVDTLTGQMSLS